MTALARLCTLSARKASGTKKDPQEEPFVAAANLKKIQTKKVQT